MKTVEERLGWANAYLPEIVEILRENSKHFVSITEAPLEDDALKATDLVIKVEGGDVAVRIRGFDKEYYYRDWTIRSIIPSKNKTELQKLREGFADWYLYAWTNSDGKIDSWMLIDLDLVRKKRILDKPWRNIPNGDGTFFIAIPSQDLEDQDCLIACNNLVLEKKTKLDEWLEEGGK